MELFNVAERLAYVLRGKNRRTVYGLMLDGIQTPSQISRSSDIAVSNVSRVLREYENNGLVTKLTSSKNQCSLYILTEVALEFKQEFLKFLEIKI